MKKPFWLLWPLIWVGRSIIALFQTLGRMVILFGETLLYTVRPQTSLRMLLRQFAFIGYQSLFVISITAFFTGGTLALQVSEGMNKSIQGVNIILGNIVGLAIFRELGPVLTAIIAAGKAGSAITAEIGTMKVTEQIDALRTLNTNPTAYLVVPRFWAAVAALPMLTVFANVVGVFGGWFISYFLLQLPSETFFEQLRAKLGLWDIVSGLIKSAVFGGVIATISCMMGLQTKGGAEGVGRATTQAVVYSSMGILVANYFLTAALTAS